MPEFYANIKDGDFISHRRFEEIKSSLKDGCYRFKIEKAKKRSGPQNSYYWGCMLPIAKHGFNDIGYDEIDDEEQVHEIFKSLFLKKHIENEDGLVIEFIGSTKKLSTIEFTEYMEKIAKFCAENLKVTIPAPGQQINIYDAAT